MFSEAQREAPSSTRALFLFFEVFEGQYFQWDQLGPLCLALSGRASLGRQRGQLCLGHTQEGAC